MLGAAGPVRSEGRSVETSRSWFVTLNITYSFTISVLCLARASVLCQACGGSWVQLALVASPLPATPQADDTCPGPNRAGRNGSSLCVSALCPVTAPKPFLGSGGMQCQVIAPHRLLLFSTTFLQPSSCNRRFLLLQTPFSSPVPQQVLFFPRNECIEDGVGRFEPAGWVSRV